MEKRKKEKNSIVSFFATISLEGNILTAFLCNINWEALAPLPSAIVIRYRQIDLNISCGRQSTRVSQILGLDAWLVHQTLAGPSFRNRCNCNLTLRRREWSRFSRGEKMNEEMKVELKTIAATEGWEKSKKKKLSLLSRYKFLISNLNLLARLPGRFLPLAGRYLIWKTTGANGSRRRRKNESKGN